MVFTFFFFLCGTGKTAIAFSIAKDLAYFLLSNDDSVIEDIYPNKAKVLDKLVVKKNENIVYDLGGFVDKGILEVIKNSDKVIIPTTIDINSIKKTIKTAMEVNKYCSDIIIVVNRVKKDKVYKYKQSLDALNGLGKKVIFISESEAFTNSIHSGKSITELYEDKTNTLSKQQYRGVFSEYSQLLKEIKSWVQIIIKVLT